MVMHENKCRIELGRSVELFIAIVALSCTFVGSARAQSASGRLPQIEIAGTYSFIQANAANAGRSFNLNGGSESLAYAFSNRFSAVVDVGAYRFRELSAGVKSTMYTYLFGPRITLSESRRAIPFAQILVGGGRLNASAIGVKAGENGFAMDIGGGLDVPFHHHFALRVIQADYLLTRFDRVTGAPAKQNSVRISAGVVIRFRGQ
jgi:hypothetical protein